MKVSDLARKLKAAINGDIEDSQRFVDALLTELAPPQNEALRQSWARGQCAMVGTVADALPNDAEKDAIVEEVFARATAAPTKRIDAAALYGELPEKEQETIREIARRAAARATRKVDSAPDTNGTLDNTPLWDKVAEISASVPDEAWDKLDPSAAGGDAAPGEAPRRNCKPTPQSGDRVGPNDVGVGDVVRETSPMHWVIDTRVEERMGDAWYGEVLVSTHPAYYVGARNCIGDWSRTTLVSRAEPPPIQLQVGHRYRARDGSEWECVEHRDTEDSNFQFLCSASGGETCSFGANGKLWSQSNCPEDLIEDLGPTPSAKPEIDVDAVLAPIERALEHITGLSNDTRASNIATTAYGVTGNVLRQAIAKAREVGR